MTKQHPLNDEIIDEIIEEFAPDEIIFDWIVDMMRASYDLGWKNAKRGDHK